MKKAIAVIAVIIVCGASYAAGYWEARRESDALALAHSLEKTALCANGLNTLAQKRQHVTGRLLDQQLRSAVETAEKLSGAGVTIDMAIPDLLDGIRRARVYAQRVGDDELSKRLTALYDTIAASQGIADV